MEGLIIVLAALYFLPLVVALGRGHHQAGMIAVLNIFLGWTFIGWVVSLALACGAVRRDPAAESAAAPVRGGGPDLPPGSGAQ